jgi:hypothetical protein
MHLLFSDINVGGEIQEKRSISLQGELFVPMETLVLELLGKAGTISHTHT